MPQDNDDSEDEAKDDDTIDETDDNKDETVRRSVRIKAGVRKPVRYAMHTKLKKGEHNDEDTNMLIAKAERVEIELVFKDLKAVEPIKKEEILTGFPAFNTHLFTVDKFKADGTRDKFKSHLAAHGNEQDSTSYPDHSSPTAQMHSVMI